MKKTMLYVGEMEFPDKNAAAQRVLANCQIIKAAISCDVVVVGLNSSLKRHPDFDIRDRSYLLGDITVYEYPYPKSAIDWLKYITQIQYIQTLVNHIGRDRISAIVAYNYPALALERLRVYCNENNIAIISDASEWYGKSKRSFPSNLVKDFDTFLRMRFINKKCGNLICASRYLENYYSKYNCNILNIPSLVVDTDAKFKAPSTTGQGQGRVYAYVGSPGKSKEKDRLDWIVGAFYQLKQSGFKSFKLIFVGVTLDSLLKCYPELRDRVHALREYIEFKGRVEHSVALETILKSDFTVFAREVNRVTTAGFPTKLAESFACSTPVITTPSSNVGDYLVNGKTGFVSTECSEKGFYDAVLESTFAEEEELLDMKEYLLHYNPMRTANFVDRCRHFLNTLY